MDAQATRAKTMVRARSSAMIFFMINPPINFSFATAFSLELPIINENPMIAIIITAAITPITISHDNIVETLVVTVDELSGVGLNKSKDIPPYWS